MKRGFTLVELLAVIVIIAIIALISVPVITEIVKEARKGALQDSAYALINAADYYYTSSAVKNKDFEQVEYDFLDGIQTSSNGKLLEYKGNIEHGKLILTELGKVVVCIDDGVNYAFKNIDEVKVTLGEGICSYDGETGNFEILTDNEELNKRIEELEKELADLKSFGNATAEDILKDKTAIVQGEKITGTYVASLNNLTCTYSTGKISFPEETQLLIFWGAAGYTETHTNSGASSPKVLERETGIKTYKVITTSSNSAYSGTVTVTVDWDNNYMTRPSVNEVMIYARAYGAK